MLKVLACALAILGLCIYIVFFSPVFKIKSINLTNENCLNSQDLEKYNLKSQNILFLNSQNFQEKLKSDFSCIDQVKIKKTLPQKIEIEIEATQAVVKIESANLAITKDGQVIQLDPQLKLPIIYLPTTLKINPGQKIIDTTTLSAIKIARLLTKTDFTIQNIRIIAGNDIAAYDTNGLIVQFSSSKSPLEQVDSLQLILSKAKIDKSKIAKIDLRFDKPVISPKTENGER